MKTKEKISPERHQQNAEIVLQVKNLSKAFGDKKVLTDFNLELKKGENLVVLGKSGSGKSVLIKCIIGLIKADKGEINVLGEDIHNLNSADLDAIRARIGFLFQSNALYDSMTVRENLEFPLRRHRTSLTRKEIDDKVMEALTNVGLTETIDMQTSELSGGMRKRIALARTLILKPEIILFDEPTTGLDPITGKEISNLMEELAHKYNTSSIIISHDLNCVRIVADRIIMLIDGTCYAEGTLESLSKSDDEKVKIFFE